MYYQGSVRTRKTAKNKPRWRWTSKIWFWKAGVYHGNMNYFLPSQFCRNGSFLIAEPYWLLEGKEFLSNPKRCICYTWHLDDCWRARGSCARNFEKEQHLWSLVKIQFGPCSVPSVVDSFHLDCLTFSPKNVMTNLNTPRTIQLLTVGQREKLNMILDMMRNCANCANTVQICVYWNDETMPETMPVALEALEAQEFQFRLRDLLDLLALLTLILS